MKNTIISELARNLAKTFSFLFFSFLFLEKIEAQVVGCNSYNLEVCRVTQTVPPPSSNPDCLAPGCFRYYYQVYIKANNGGTSITFSSLEVAATLQTPGTGSLSMVNELATESCVAGQFSTYIGVDGNTVAFDMPLEPSNYFFSTGQQLLFTIVVDAFPGEELDLVMNGVFTVGPLTCSNMSVQPCGFNDLEPFTMSEPASCQNPSPCVGVTDVSAGNPYNMPVEIPVYFDKGSTGIGNVSIDEIDVAIKMTSTNLMEVPTILSGEMAASNVRIITDGTGYTIYAHAQDLAFFTGANGQSILFTIKLNGPVFQSAGGTATFNTTNARVQLTGATCCKPCLGGQSTVVFDGFTPCADDITFSIGASPNQPPAVGEQCKAAVNVTVGWTAPPNSRTAYKLKILVDVETSGNVSIFGLGTSDLACPTNGASYCGGTDCFTIVDANTFQYCFWVFPTGINVVNETGFQVLFDVSSGCIEGMTFREAYIDLIGGGPSQACYPNISVDVNDFPICSPVIEGEILTADNDKVAGSYNIDISGSCFYNLTQNCESIYGKCVCNPNGSYTITPSKNDDVLCGVTTYDLVLLSKHILGVAPFTSPYEWVAADVNNSNTVTTFDLVEIRKVILRINEEFLGGGYAPSWKFVDKSYVFPQLPVNPPQADLPDYPTDITVTSFPATANFVAVKMGDINLSCTANGGCTAFSEPLSEERDAANLQLFFDSYNVSNDEIITIPIQINTNTPLSAYQMGIHFNTEALEYVGSAKADIEGITKESFGLTELDAGKIRMLWFSADGGEHQKIENSQKLFYLAFKAKKNLKDFGSELWLEDAVLPNIGYDISGDDFGMELTAQKIARFLTSVNEIVTCHPNPFAGELSFSIRSTSMGEAKIWLFDAFGVRRLAKTVDLKKGLNEIMLEESKSLPSGLFNWVVTTPDGRQSGMVVKQTQP